MNEKDLNKLKNHFKSRYSKEFLSCSNKISLSTNIFYEFHLKFLKLTAVVLTVFVIAFMFFSLNSFFKPKNIQDELNKKLDMATEDALKKLEIEVNKFHSRLYLKNTLNTVKQEMKSHIVSRDIKENLSKITRSRTDVVAKIIIEDKIAKFPGVIKHIDQRHVKRLTSVASEFNAAKTSVEYNDRKINDYMRRVDYQIDYINSSEEELLNE